jgi:hypothetical protein
MAHLLPKAFLALMAVGLCLTASAGVQAPKPPPIRVAYFVPSDRKVLADHTARLDRVMTEVQRFYREGMAAAGHGPLTFELERDAGAKLRLYVVNGKHPMETYGRNDSGAVRAEVRAALKAEGVDIDREVVLIFQVLLKWEGGKAVEVGPYVGGGNGRTGTAWVYDDERLDPQRLDSREPGGYYGRPCSIGEFNSHYVGGVAHELGHAFGLPHDCESVADRRRGKSLMGGGNHTYGQEKRGEGPGSFLSPVSALLLRTSRPFAGDLPDAAAPPTSSLEDLEARFADGRITLTGIAKGRPAIWALAAYDDLARITGDYDAVGWTCTVAGDGRFRLEVGEMRQGLSQLRIRTCHANGGAVTHSFDYTVDEKRVPDLAIFRYAAPVGRAVQAFLDGDRPKAEALAKDLLQRFADVEIVRRKAAHLLALLNPSKPQALAEVRPDVTTVAIPRLAFEKASVGWGQVQRDRVPEQLFLQVGGMFHESGLYAHAPARHAMDLGGGWKRFRSGYGLQDNIGGSVAFVVLGDGKELFRSPTVKDHVAREIDVSVEKVGRLELVVEDGGDGNRSDWGVWLSPRLER